MYQILVIFHIISGNIDKYYSDMISSGISIIGVSNIICILYMLINIINRKIVIISHKYLKTLTLLFAFYSLPYIYNFDIYYSIRILSYYGAIISIYYLSQSYLFNLHDIDKHISKILYIIIIVFSIFGIVNLLKVRFDYELSRQNKFDYYIFEYPHSFGIFISGIIPLTIWYVKNNYLGKISYPFIFLLLPLGIYYSGSRIAIITYVSSIIIFYILEIMINKNVNIKSKLIYILITIVVILLIMNTSVTNTVIEEISIDNLYNYFYQAYRTPINTFQSRTNNWVFIYDKLIIDRKLLVGEGWRKWGYYQNIYGSLQSDYATVLFEMGLLGLIGLIIFRINIIINIYNIYKKYGNTYVIAILSGILAMYIGSFTENVDGYPSTNWNIPILFALAECYVRKK